MTAAMASKATAGSTATTAVVVGVLSTVMIVAGVGKGVKRRHLRHEQRLTSLQ